MINAMNFTGIRGLHYIHGNIRSMLKKLSQIKHYLLDSNISCLGLSETWLTDLIPDYMLYIPGFQVVRSDRAWRNLHGNIKKGGGICCYINIEQPHIKKCILNNIFLIGDCNLNIPVTKTLRKPNMSNGSNRLRDLNNV